MKNCPNIRILGKPSPGHHASSSPAAGVAVSRRGRRAVCCALLGALIALLPPPAAAATDAKVLRLATTTSTENSGLLAHLLPTFEKRSGYRVHVIAVGTGKALKLGEQGDVDIVMVHARKAEQAFIAAGHGRDRREIMYNDFVVIGPPDDPAGIATVNSAAEAFGQIAKSEQRFVSRGDDSGTHKRELYIWHLSGRTPGGRWYVEAGQGMGKVIQMAAELDAYTLTDRGTWISFEDKVPLKLLFERDPPLVNTYGVIAVDPLRHPHVDYAGATALIEWLSSDEGQLLINDYKLRGKQLFYPLIKTDL
jgi:tungstate transport system substrate-binding protein